MNLGTMVGPDTFVTLAYTLYDDEGDVIDRTEEGEPLSYLHGYGQIVPGLERGVEGMSKGDVRQVLVAASEGYGEYDPEAVFEVDRNEFPRPDEVAPGDEYVAESEEGEGIPLTVLEVKGDSCVVDANHPLAGEALRFDVTVLDVRPATDGEIRKAEQALAAESGDGAELISLGLKPKGRGQPS